MIRQSTENTPLCRQSSSDSQSNAFVGGKAKYRPNTLSSQSESTLSMMKQSDSNCKGCWKSRWEDSIPSQLFPMKKDNAIRSCPDSKTPLPVSRQCIEDEARHNAKPVVQSSRQDGNFRSSLKPKKPFRRPSSDGCDGSLIDAASLLSVRKPRRRPSADHDAIHQADTE